MALCEQAARFTNEAHSSRDRWQIPAPEDTCHLKLPENAKFEEICGSVLGFRTV
jgi:hypothetical protein